MNMIDRKKLESMTTNADQIGSMKNLMENMLSAEMSGVDPVKRKKEERRAALNESKPETNFQQTGKIGRVKTVFVPGGPNGTKLRCLVDDANRRLLACLDFWYSEKVFNDALQNGTPIRCSFDMQIEHDSPDYEEKRELAKKIIRDSGAGHLPMLNLKTLKYSGFDFEWRGDEGNPRLSVDIFDNEPIEIPDELSESDEPDNWEFAVHCRMGYHTEKYCGRFMRVSDKPWQYAICSQSQNPAVPNSGCDIRNVEAGVQVDRWLNPEEFIWVNHPEGSNWEHGGFSRWRENISESEEGKPLADLRFHMDMMDFRETDKMVRCDAYNASEDDYKSTEPLERAANVIRRKGCKVSITGMNSYPNSNATGTFMVNPKQLIDAGYFPEGPDDDKTETFIFIVDDGLNEDSFYFIENPDETALLESVIDMDDLIELRNRIKQEGRDAFDDGLGMTACKYENLGFRDAWMEGWKERRDGKAPPQPMDMSAFHASTEADRELTEKAEFWTRSQIENYIDQTRERWGDAAIVCRVLVDKIEWIDERDGSGAPCWEIKDEVVSISKEEALDLIADGKVECLDGR